MAQRRAGRRGLALHVGLVGVAQALALMPFLAIEVLVATVAITITHASIDRVKA